MGNETGTTIADIQRFFDTRAIGAHAFLIDNERVSCVLACPCTVYTRLRRKCKCKIRHLGLSYS